MLLIVFYLLVFIRSCFKVFNISMYNTRREVSDKKHNFIQNLEYNAKERRSIVKQKVVVLCQPRLLAGT